MRLRIEMIRIYDVCAVCLCAVCLLQLRPYGTAPLPSAKQGWKQRLGCCMGTAKQVRAVRGGRDVALCRTSGVAIRGAGAEVCYNWSKAAWCSPNPSTTCG